MKFFYAPNTVAVATVIAMNEAGLEYEPVRVDFAKSEQTSAEFLAVNPKGRVPALVTDQGILSETGALLDYVAALAPDAGLIPQDAFAAAQVRSVIHYLASTMHVAHAHKLRGHRWADAQSSFEDMRAKVPQTMAASCAFIEEQIKGPLLFGDALTLADCHLYTISLWLEGDGVDIADFPKLNTLTQTMAQRPSVQKAVAEGFIIQN